MDARTKCYICGRTQSEISDYLRAIRLQTIAGEIGELEITIDRFKSSMRDTEASIEQLKSLCSEIPESDRLFRIETIQNDREAFAKSHRATVDLLEGASAILRLDSRWSIQELIDRIGDLEATTQMASVIKNADEIQSRLTVLKAVQEYEKSSDSPLRFAAIRNMRVPREDSHMRKGEDFAKALSDIVRVFECDFEKALLLLDAIAQIKPLVKSRVGGTPLGERWDSIINKIDTEEWIRSELTYDKYEQLRHRRGVRITDRKKTIESILPESLGVPVCELCIELTRTPMS